MRSLLTILGVGHHARNSKSLSSSSQYSPAPLTAGQLLGDDGDIYSGPPQQAARVSHGSHGSHGRRMNSYSSETVKPLNGEETTSLLKGRYYGFGDGASVSMSSDYSYGGTVRGATVASWDGDDGKARRPVATLVVRDDRLSRVLDGVTLLTECVANIVTLSVFVWVTVWQRRDSSDGFWGWLWSTAAPVITVQAAICFAALVTHETRPDGRGLSTMTLLFVQMGVLVLATGTAVTVAARCTGSSTSAVGNGEDGSRAAKGAVMGCGTLVWSVALMGFGRAAMVWGAAGEDDGEVSC
ncbi:hypothetical protein GMORB2_7100 [Geosmithia morbida]|uniref:Uncharacterized protein n=1 Tax=Geosmithia morbida TaxID=1094350 RepID=A0A9P5D0J3_9HYPO|nr:uncharacterized protein GMORB2_7100 [Geosmithia morbida]KAF4122793.1 hypothetical protein GMORB2_7100 [Geosmithia morbida]